MKIFAPLQFLIAAATLTCTLAQEAPFESRVIEDASHLFHHSPDGKIEDPNVRPLPPTREGEARYDIRKWLETQGAAPFPSGASAVYLEPRGVVVARMPAARLDLVERILETSHDWIVILQLEISTNLWSYESDQAPDPLKSPRTLEQIQGQAGKSLTLLDSHTLTVKSGNRSRASHRLATANTPAPNSANPPPTVDAETGKIPQTVLPLPDGSRGWVLEIEPNTDRVENMVNLQLEYHTRLPQLGGEPDVTFDFSDNATLHTGANVVVCHQSSQGAAGGKFRSLALTVSAQIVDGQGRTLDEVRKAADRDRKLEIARKEGLIRRALEDLPKE